MTLAAVPSEPWSEEAALEDAKTLTAEELHAERLAIKYGYGKKGRPRLQHWLRKWFRQGLIAEPAKFRKCKVPKADQETTSEPVAQPETVQGDVLEAGDTDPWQKASEPPKPTEPNPYHWEPSEVAEVVTTYVPFRRKVLAVVLGIISIVLAVVGLLLNMTFAYSLGRTEDSGDLLATIGIVLDVLTLVLPTVAAMLWDMKKFLAAGGVWLMCALTLAATLMAACGFASTNTTEVGVKRLDVVNQRTVVVEKLDTLRKERRDIKETRSVAEIDVALQTAQPMAEMVWKQTKGCTLVTLKESGQACATVLVLRQSRGEAERRVRLDSQIAENEKTLAGLPPIASADPGAEMSVTLLRMMTGGLVNVTVDAIKQFRIVVFTVMPAMGGILLSFAMMLWRPTVRVD